MAGVFSVPILSVLDDQMLLALIDGLLLVAGRRRGAARRRQRRLLRRSSAAARTRRLRRAARASSAALAVPRGSLTAASRPRQLSEYRRVTGRCFSRCAYVCARATCVSDATNSPLHEGMRTVA